VKQNRHRRLRQIIGSNGGLGGRSGRCQLPDGDGEVEDDAGCQSEQENYLT